jgi:putative N6-adenine-specific DNA methylase
MRIYNFLTENTVTIYLDTSGEALFKRGYRSARQEAPLKENLACGLLKLSGWEHDKPLFDPMCGSGTIVIEAVHMALNIAPGLKRTFAFEQFDNFYQKDWDDMKSLAKSAIINDKTLDITASDISMEAIIQTENNLKHARLREHVRFSCKDILDIQAPQKPGVMLINPPYGIRLNELDELGVLYPKIASHLKQNFDNWNCYFFTADLRLPKLMRLKPSKKTPLFNGALDCRLFEFKMVRGSNR